MDTGVTCSFSGSCAFSARAVSYDVPMHIQDARGNSFELGFDVSGAAIACGDWKSRGTVNLYAYSFGLGENYASRVTIGTTAGACPQPYIGIAVSWSVTGLRLIAGLTTPGGGRYLTYRLWSDSGTSWTLTVGGRTITTAGAAGGTSLTSPTISFTDYVVNSMGAPVIGTATPLSDGIKIENIVWNSEADPTTRDDLAYEGTTSTPGVVVAHTFTTKPPLKYDVDVRVEDAGGAAPAHTVLVANPAGQGVSVTNPNTGSANVWRPTGVNPGYVNGVLSGSWTDSGIDPVELDVPIRQIVPKRPSGGPEYWTPATLSIASPVDVLLSANNWSKTGSIALSGTGHSTWTVTGAGTVSRALAGVYAAADTYTTTKHTAGDDVFGWGLYSYLELNLTSSVSATLTLTITWNTNPATGATTTRAYTFTVTATTATYRIDLLFPDAATEPDYFERVTNLSLAGFANGVYTLNSCQLVAVESAYVKHAQTFGWTGLAISQDGSFPSYWWGPNPVLAGAVLEKDDECAQFGGANQQLGGSVRMDGTIQDAMTELARMEGVTTTYSGATIAADLTDGTEIFGNLTGPANYDADWIHTQLSARVAPGATLNLDASIRFDGADLCPAAAGDILLPFRVTLGMMLEALCITAGGARAGAGFGMVARRSPTGTPDPSDPVIGSGTTDASGFVSVPIPVGQASGADFYAYLEGV